MVLGAIALESPLAAATFSSSGRAARDLAHAGGLRRELQLRARAARRARLSSRAAAP